jgi:hypothetical protein
MSAELKTCGHCGGETVIVPGYTTDGVRAYGPEWFIAKCRECGCITSKCDTEKEAVVTWNARVEESSEIFGRGLTCGIVTAAAEIGAGSLDQPTMAAEILKSAHIHSMSDVPDYVDEYDRDRLASIAEQMWGGTE